MKPRFMGILLLSAALWAQSGYASSAPEASSQPSGPSYSQLYCSGFVTRAAISRSSYVIGAKESPREDRFEGRATLFLHGAELVPGERYSIVRQISDPNREDSSSEQRRRLVRLGDLYEDVGWATVHSVEKGTAIASFDFSCGVAMPGDVLMRFQERPQFTFRTPEPPLDSFRVGSATVKGHILGGRDFIGLLGNGLIAYTDFGSAKGAKPGDYLVISRGYAPEDFNKVDRTSELLPRGTESTAVHQAEVPHDADKRLPNRILGEMLVLNVSAEASTALITRVSAEVELGDAVQLEGAQAEGGQAAATGVTVAEVGGGAAPCQSASRLRRVFFRSHACKAAKE